MDKKQLTIPTFVWVIAVAAILSILFIIFVQVPYNKQAPKYDADHASAQSEISMYKDYLARADQVSKQNAEMSKQYQELSNEMFINATQTADDVRTMLGKLGYSLSTLSVTEGSDTGVISSTGNPLYVTNIGYTFTTTKQKALETLKYFEEESQGAYFISSLNFSKVNADSDTQISSAKSSASDLYTVNLTISLYYYDPSKNKGMPSSSAASASSAA